MGLESDVETRFRRHKGAVGTIERIFLALIPVTGIVGILNIFLYFGISLWIQQYLAVLLALTLAMAPLLVPATRKAPRDRLAWYDAVLSVGGLVIGLYLAIFYQKLQLTAGLITVDRLILGIIAIFIVLECCRRLMGWSIVIMIALFILYPHFADLCPGPLRGRAVPWERLAVYLYIDEGALLGIPLRVTGTIVLAFMFFGQALFTVGGEKFFTDAAISLMGKFRGGPAKAAVIGSGVFGIISGSVVANIATTGVVTIPMMKKLGYQPHVAAAVEATTGCGDQLAPPVMGTVAFIMATFLGLPYWKVALAGLIPSILYYLSIFMQVHFHAIRTGLRGFPSEELPSFKRIALENWIFIIPGLVIIYTMFVLQVEPDVSGLWAVASVFVISVIKKVPILNPRKIFAILEGTGEGLLEILVIGAMAGFAVGAVLLSALGHSLSLALLQLAGGDLVTLLLVTAMAAMVLGLGVSTTPVYIIVVILLAPALIQAGMIPLSAHLFVLYFAVLGFLTPPEMMAVYTAASIAHSDPIKTAWQAMRFGIAAYLVPFVFAFDSSLLLQGSAADIVPSAILAILGIILLSAGIEGCLFLRLNWFKRILFIAGAAGLLSHLWVARGVGMAILLPLFLFEWKMRGDCQPSKRLEGGLE
ncbi:MAG: TRAP transporter permease [Thermodesulfobacteriota bacterium]